MLRTRGRDRDQAQELPLGSLHRLLAADPAKGLAILKGLSCWEHGRVYSEVRVPPSGTRLGSGPKWDRWGIEGRRQSGCGQGWGTVIGDGRKK